MRFLADENIPLDLVRHLRKQSHHVLFIAQSFHRRSGDPALYHLAIRERRILLTFDKHFANPLAYPPSQSYGIIRLRIHPPIVDDLMAALDHVLADKTERNLRGQLFIVESHSVRIIK